MSMKVILSVRNLQIWNVCLSVSVLLKDGSCCFGTAPTPSVSSVFSCWAPTRLLVFPSSSHRDSVLSCGYHPDLLHVSNQELPLIFSPWFFSHEFSFFPVLSSAMFNLWYIANLVLCVLLFSYKNPLIYIGFISLNDTLTLYNICQHYFSIALSNNHNVWFLGIVWLSHMSFGFVLCLSLTVTLRNLSVLCMTIPYCEFLAMPFSVELTWTCF